MNTQEQIPHQSYLQIFMRFLRFGFLAWGGPVAQIAMIRQELVEEEKWISPERFNRVLAVYQALPGPEAHELCVYFGMVARGRIGAFLAGLGFMTPGFLLMLAFSWFYITFGINTPALQSVFLGMQPAVAALIVRAVHRIGTHALQRDVWLWCIAIFAGVAQLLNVNFLIPLLVGGLTYAFIKRGRTRFAFALIAVSIFSVFVFDAIFLNQATSNITREAILKTTTISSLFFSGLRAGLLTFGGAYTAIPFIRHDAVEIGAWMTNAQFLDGIALSGLLPAPLIIFSTFVGYIGDGVLGAIAMTFGVFAPAFAFTMIGHHYLERLVENTSLHAFLDGVTAGVVGLITAVAIGILAETLISPFAWVIGVLALAALYLFKPKWTTAVVIVIAGLLGLIFI
ncbi:MAG: chromate efflux transporter [Anaerolineales bacterium]